MLKSELASENAALRARVSDLTLQLAIARDMQAKPAAPSAPALSAWKLRAAALRSEAMASGQTLRML